MTISLVLVERAIGGPFFCNWPHAALSHRRIAEITVRHTRRPLPSQYFYPELAVLIAPRLVSSANTVTTEQLPNSMCLGPKAPSASDFHPPTTPTQPQSAHPFSNPENQITSYSDLQHRHTLPPLTNHQRDLYTQTPYRRPPQFRERETCIANSTRLYTGI